MANSTNLQNPALNKNIFIEELSQLLDHQSRYYENILTIGDFNMVIKDKAIYQLIKNQYIV